MAYIERPAMDEFINNFVRDPSGAWRCIQAAELQVAVGRIQVAPGTTFTRGTAFMGLDVAALLDQYEREGKAPLSGASLATSAST